MTKDEYEKLEVVAAPDDKVRLRVLYSATIDTLKTLNSKYSQTSLKNWQSAEAALEEFAAKISGGHSETVEFRTVKEVYTYLKAIHPRAVQSTIYNHFKKGFLAKNKQGVFDRDIMEAYAQKYIKKPTPTTEAELIKADPDYRWKVGRADEQEFKVKMLEGYYTPTSEVGRELAKRAAYIRSDMENNFRTHAAELISTCQGNAIYLPDVIDTLLGWLETWLSRYSEKIEFTLSPEAAAALKNED